MPASQTTPAGPGKEASPTAAAPESGEMSPARRRLGYTSIILIILVLFSAGFVCSYSFLGPADAPEPSAHNTDAAPPVALPQEPAPVPPAAAIVRDLKTGDTLLREGRFDAALALYERVDGGPPPRVELLHLRIGMCLEGLGRWEDALSAYRFAAGRGTPEVVRTALLGQARTLIRLGHVDEAKNVLYASLLRSAAPDLDDPEFLAEGRFLLALALSFNAMPRVRATPLEDVLVRPSLQPWKLQTALPWDKEPAAAKKRKDMPAAIVVQKGTPAAEKRLVDIRVEQSDVARVLEDLTKLGGLKITWSKAARQRVQGRTVRIRLNDWPFLDVVRALTSPLNLRASVKDAVLHVLTDEEGAKTQLISYRMETAESALHTAVLMHPRHPLTPAAYLELGSLEAAAGQLAKAVAWYERLIKGWPRSVFLVEANYNAGMLYRKQGRLEKARKAFYRVVDHNPGHELTPLSLLHIGEMLLNEGDAQGALSPLRRAAAASSGSSAQAAAVITLAAAYVMTDNPLDANTLLRKNRDVLAEKTYRPTAAFLDAYALFRSSVARRETRREAPAVLAALLDLRDRQILGTPGKYLIGKAYGDLGMWLEVIQTYEKLIGTSKNKLGNEMTFRMAEALYKVEKGAEAVPLLTNLAGTKDVQWSAAARFQLAVIALNENRPQDCLRECLRLWQERQPVDRPALLHLMGESYARLGDHERAARCYAGKPPE